MAQLPIADPAPIDGALPEQVHELAESRTFHAYIHVPFCSIRCGYCDFNTYTSSELDGFKKSDFVDQLIQELHLSQRVISQANLPERSLQSVFFGGGTPTQLQSQDLVSALATLRDVFGILAGAEVTTEANPDSVDSEYLKTLANGGFNRISFGMQSAVESVLKTLERTHNPENVPVAVKAAKDAGLKTSVDLIYGAPGETIDDWRRSVDAALNLETDHISAYALIVEPGTKLHRQIKAGQLSEPDEDLEADKYEYADEAFSAAGFNWYELSNFARTREDESTHNIAYWQGQDWWGYGPGAHSHIGGVRWWNAKHPTAYAKPLVSGLSPAVGRETLTSQTRLEERVMLEIRLSKGLSIDVLRLATGEVAKKVSELIADELVDATSALRGYLVLTLRGRLLADGVVKRLLA